MQLLLLFQPQLVLHLIVTISAWRHTMRFHSFSIYSTSSSFSTSLDRHCCTPSPHTTRDTSAATSFMHHTLTITGYVPNAIKTFRHGWGFVLFGTCWRRRRGNGGKSTLYLDISLFTSAFSSSVTRLEYNQKLSSFFTSTRLLCLFPWEQ